jgi:hypothetical protein
MYEDELSMGDARQRYFVENRFDGSYSERWVKLKAGPITLAFPNAPGRVRAVKLHDLHHVVTDYPTTWTGEAEIAAWEIATGCGRFGWAWYLNLQGLAIGVGIAPRAVWRAFIRGRHTRNLYHGYGAPTETLLARRVGDIRRELGLDRRAGSARAWDGVAFAAWVCASLVLLLFPAALILYALIRLLTAL